VELELKGAVAVVTGASKGIGLAVVRALLDEGATVVGGARRSSPELDELAATGGVEIVLGDLGTPEAPARLVAAAGDRVDVLVNNVGAVTPRTGGFLEVTDEQWLASMDLDLMSAVRATRAALPVMLAAGRGAIVNVASVNALLPDPLVVDYGAAKAALWNLAKSLSKEFGPRGIRVNSVLPGPVATDLWLGERGVAATLSAGGAATADEVARAAVAGTATGRFTTPAEVADLVVLLASPRTANVTGAALTVDGGLVPTL
jgi:NAD(P)-dependent dehydrogenase (short-subunit alcohol dehydrogenase family)